VGEGVDRGRGVEQLTGDDLVGPAAGVAAFSGEQSE
jgi:hypothetical protein